MDGMKLSEDRLKKVRGFLANGTPSFSRNTVYQLMRHIEAQEAEINQLIGNVAKQYRELKDLQEGKKIPVPREVAEALDYLFKDGNESEKQWIFFNVVKLDKECVGDSAKIVKRHFDVGRYLDLAAAILNGYTVEEPTTEDKMKEVIAFHLRHYQVTSGISIESLAAVLTREVREVLAEDRQVETN